MDPVTVSAIAASTISILSPLVAKGMEEVTKSVFKDAYEKIKDRFSTDQESKKALEEFEKKPAEAAPELLKILTNQMMIDEKLTQLLAETLKKSKVVNLEALVGKVEAEKVVVASHIDTVNM
jgi:dipeptidase